MKKNAKRLAADAAVFAAAILGLALLQRLVMTKYMSHIVEGAMIA